LRAEAEKLFAVMTKKIAEVDPLKQQVEEFSKQKQPSELARRCTDEVSRLRSEETKLNQDAADVGSSPLWHGTEFRYSHYVDEYVKLNIRSGLLSKAASTLSMRPR
jgi:hypothetical protein